MFLPWDAEVHLNLLRTMALTNDPPRRTRTGKYIRAVESSI